MRLSNLLVFALLLLNWGCAKTYQARRVETSGFLGDYSQLNEGKDGEALLVYRNPAAVFSRYDKVIVDDISIWRPADSELAEVSDEDAQRLAQALHDAILEKLEEDYEIVRAPGPGVLRVRAAITEAAESYVVLDTMASVLPHVRAVSLVTRLTTGTSAFTGRASGEAEILDAVTGERLLAGVDRRVGNTAIRGALSSWDDVQETFDFWAERIRNRLREERQKEQEKEKEKGSRG